MQEKKSESSSPKNPKKANLLDHHSIKHILDESVSEIVASRGYAEDVRMSNVRLFLGTVVIVIALFAQFYNKKFPENRDFLLLCIVLYVIFNGLLQLLIYTKEKNAILFTYPLALRLGRSLGIADWSLSGDLSKTPSQALDWWALPNCQDSLICTLVIASADPKSISANQPVQFSKSVTQWFTKDGILVEGLFWKDVEALIYDYQREPKKKK